MKQELLALGVSLSSIAFAGGLGSAGPPVSLVQAGELPRRELAALAEAPKRVVSVALLPEELLVDVLPEERWVGISPIVDWSGSTAAYGRFPRTAKRTNGTAEAILGLEPDLVLLSDYNQPTIEAALDSAGVRVWRVKSPSTLPELFAEWRKLGELVHRASEVEPLVRAAEARYQRIEDAVPPATALFLQGYYAYADGALQTACAKSAGFRNLLEGDARGPTPKLSDEELATLQPDFLFLAAPVASATSVEPGAPLPGLPHGAFEGSRAKVFLVPEALVGAISQYALDACELYVKLAQGDAE